MTQESDGARLPASAPGASAASADETDPSVRESQRVPLSDVQRDALIRTMTRQLREAEDVIRDLRAELVAVEQENARLKAGLIPEQPFT